MLDQALSTDGYAAETRQTLEFVDLSACRHKDSFVWGLEVSESHSISPTHDAFESRFTYPHLPVLACLSPLDSLCSAEFGRGSCYWWNPHQLRQKREDDPRQTLDNILSKHKTTQQQNQTITSLNTKWISGCLKDFTSFHSFGNPSQRCLTAGYHANEPFAVNKLTLAASWDVRVATFSWEASSSRRSFLICWLKEEKRKVNVWLHMNATKEALSYTASPA